MAGLGRKVWSAGEVVLAADMQGYLQDQTVQVYAGTAAAGSALGTAVSEGMIRYLSDSNEIHKYTGSSWEGIAPVSPNAIINGAFDIWQRGTSATIPLNDGGYFAPDRFIFYSGNSTSVISRVAGPSDFQYGLQIQPAAGNSQFNIEHRLEYSSAAALVGKVVTLSFYIYVDSASGVSAKIFNYYPSALDNWNSSTFVQKGSLSSTDLISGSWVRKSFTFTADQSSFGLGFAIELNGVALKTVRITGLQVEAGSVATPFSRAGGTIQGELAACQRYYYRASDTGAIALFNGGALTTTIADTLVVFPVTMRTKPTSIDTANLQWWNYGNNTFYNTGTFTSPNSNPNSAQVRYTHGSAVLTPGQVGAIATNTNGYIGFNAEL